MAQWKVNLYLSTVLFLPVLDLLPCGEFQGGRHTYSALLVEISDMVFYVWLEYKQVSLV